MLELIFCFFSLRCHNLNTSDYEDEEEEEDTNDSTSNSSRNFNQTNKNHLPNQHKLHHQCRINHRNHPGLIDIAKRTIMLIRRNQELQNRLHELQRETKDFIETVMSNPENKNLRNTK